MIQSTFYWLAGSAIGVPEYLYGWHRARVKTAFSEWIYQLKLKIKS